MKVPIVSSGRAAGDWTQETSWDAIAYLVIALPLALYFYLATTPEAQSFFAGYTADWVPDSPRGPLGLAGLLGALLLWRLRLRGHRALSLGWLALSAVFAVAFRSGDTRWELAAAFGLCLPGWIGQTVWLRQFWSGADDKPIGTNADWLKTTLLLATAMVMAFGGSAVFLVVSFPQLGAGPMARVLLPARVAALAGLAGLACLPGLLVVKKLLEFKGMKGRAMLVALGLLLEMAVAATLLNSLRFVGGIFLDFTSCLFVLALTFPAVALFCRRAAVCGDTVAEALLEYGCKCIGGGWKRRPSSLVALRVAGWVGALILIQVCSGYAHLYYEWGMATATVYSGLTLAGVWLLLTILPPRAKTVLIACCPACIALGMLTFWPPVSANLPWNTYLKFDKNFGSVVNAYYRRHPRPEPAFREARQWLANSHSDTPLDLTQVHPQELILKPRSARPNVFFIVADALRGESYGASTEGCGRFPGLDWMATRFTSYANAWTSYNSTRGSYPAYLNGLVQPAWYEYFWDYPVRQDNILSRACDRAGYRCYNFATFTDDFAPCWPAKTCVTLHPGGIGLGDPGVVFPQALETLDAHLAESPQQPAFLYLHLFNMHQPLYRRAGIRLQSHGMYFMRALYEQNVAYFDEQLLRFLKGLQARGLLDNSMVVVCADHGEEMFEQGGVYHGWQINPWVMHVPLLVHYPLCLSAAPGPGVVNRPANLIDLAPTICEAMGVEIVRHSSWQGVSLLAPEPAEPRSFLLLSWKNPLVGRMSFNPTRMLVLDLNSGQEQAFTPGPQGWVAGPGTSPPSVLASEFSGTLAKLFDYWEMAQARHPAVSPGG